MKTKVPKPRETLSVGQYLRIPEQLQKARVIGCISEYAEPMKWWEGLPDYVDENMHIFRQFLQFSVRMRNTGRDHYGARSIIEVVRYHSQLEDTSEFKINNNASSEFARLAMLMFPKTFPDGWFEIRENIGRATRPTLHLDIKERYGQSTPLHRRIPRTE